MTIMTISATACSQPVYCKAVGKAKKECLEIK